MKNLLRFLSIAATVAAVMGLVSPANAVRGGRGDMQCVSKTADVGSLNQGVDTLVTYAITIRNGGSIAATGVVIEDTLPAGATFVSSSCTESSGVVTCNVGDVAAGAQVSRYIVVEFVDPQPNGDPDYLNSADVSSTSTDSNSGNNNCQLGLDVIPVVLPPDLMCVSKTVDKDTLPIEGGSLTYVVTVKNNGAGLATGVTVTDVLYGAVNVTGANPNSCNGTTGTIECTLPDLLAGLSDTLTLSVNVPALAAGTVVTNSASVDGNEVDPTPGNNAGAQCAVATTIVERGGDGCTPGYWRNHLDQWAFTPYSPGDSWEATFGVTLGGSLVGITLGEGINLGGGGVRKVIRHGTAGLLSAAHPSVDYPFTVAEVIAMVQSGNVDALVAANEAGCSID